jgi:hypothetical protein
MALRDLVMGGSGCAVPGSDGSSSSNPLGGLADSILGSASKSQARCQSPLAPCFVLYFLHFLVSALPCCLLGLKLGFGMQRGQSVLVC